jgi:hypothetical protein
MQPLLCFVAKISAGWQHWIRFGQMPYIDCLANEDVAELEEEWHQLRQVSVLKFS